MRCLILKWRTILFVLISTLCDSSWKFCSIIFFETIIFEKIGMWHYFDLRTVTPESKDWKVLIHIFSKIFEPICNFGFSFWSKGSELHKHDILSTKHMHIVSKILNMSKIMKISSFIKKWLKFRNKYYLLISFRNSKRVRQYIQTFLKYVFPKLWPADLINSFIWLIK